MKLIYKIVFATCLILGLGGNNAIANPNSHFDKKDFTKTIKKEYEISKDGLVKLSNRYGKVDLNTWEKDRVKVEVKITVRASSESVAQRDFERIQIHFSDTPNMVSAETEISTASSKSSWWGWQFTCTKSDFSIDYQVFMPASCDLELSNKYGDAHISSLEGDTRLNIKYGDFEFAGTEGDLDVYLGYGNGRIDAVVGDLNADGAYCSLKVGKADDIEINSKYSKIRIEEATDIHSYSKYDSYHIEKVGNLRNEGKYDNINVGVIKDMMIISKHTDLNVNRLTNSANFELKYGGARLDDVAKGFSEIILVGNHTNYKINVEEGADYKVEAETDDNSGVKCHSDFKVDEFSTKGSTDVNGYLGKKNAHSLIKAQLTHGGLKIW